MSNGAPRTISVIIPCFNHARFLAECIQSVLSQNFPGLQIIVINDGSSDDTDAVARSFGDRIDYVEQPNQGLAAARNTGIRRASGEFLHFLDADDFIGPGMYAIMVPALQCHPECAVAYCGYQSVDVTGAALSSKPPLAPMADAFETLLDGNPWPCHTIVVRRRAVEEAGAFDVALRSCEDWDLWLRLAAKNGRFVAVPGEFACYRIYQASMSKNLPKMLETALTVIDKNIRTKDVRQRYPQALKRARRFAWANFMNPEIGRCLDEGRIGAIMSLFGRVGLNQSPLIAWSLGGLIHQKRRVIAAIFKSKPLQKTSGALSRA